MATIGRWVRIPTKSLNIGSKTGVKAKHFNLDVTPLLEELAVKEIRGLATDAEKLARLNTIATWENPGPGSFYDDIGNIAQSEHVLRGESLSTDPLMRRHMNPDFMWWDDGRSRLRQSWVSKMDWPMGLRYDDLDPEASYIVRTTGLSQCLLRVNGERVTEHDLSEGDIVKIGRFEFIFATGGARLRRGGGHGGRRPP